MRDGLINYAGPLSSRLIGILLVPFMLHHLGAEAYGLWIAASSLAGLVALFDLGLGWSVMREVAGGARDPDEATIRLVGATNSATVALTSVGAVVIALSGLFLTEGLHLSGSLRTVAPLVFGLVACGFIGDQILSYLTQIVHGLRRFDLVNAISVASSLARAAGIIVVLAAGGAIIAVVAWQVLATAATTIGTAIMIRRLAPSLPLRPGRFGWRWVREHLGFGVFSQLTLAVSLMTWNLPPLLIGTMLGSAAIVPYHIALRFPLAAAQVGTSAGEVLMPAASEYDRGSSRLSTGDLLEAGTRWILALVLPLCVVLWIIAPKLLQAWLGSTTPATVALMRLGVLIVLADSLGAAASNVFWGAGAVRIVFMARGAGMLIMLVLTAAALPRIGVMGAGWGLLAAVVASTVALVAAASRTCRVSAFGLMRSAFRGLTAPVLGCAAVAALGISLSAPGRWQSVIVTSIAAGAAYLGLFFQIGARDQERPLMSAIARRLSAATVRAEQRARRALRPVWMLRSAWYFAVALGDVARWGSRRIARYVDDMFSSKPDPWGYAAPLEQGRMNDAIAVLDAALGSRHPARALEIGCAEGFFTEKLAPRCASLLAVDLSDLALTRAAERCAPSRNVTYMRWDLLRDPLLQERFDLIVVMGVLDLMLRRRELALARERLVALLASGGLLLVSNTREGEVSESAAWGRWLIKGAKWKNAFVAAHPALEKVSEYCGDSCIHTLLRKAR